MAGSELGALCRPVKVFSTKLRETFEDPVLYSSIVDVKQERAFPKLLLQSWK